MHEIYKEAWGYAQVACCTCGVIYDAMTVLSEKALDGDDVGHPGHGEKYIGKDCRVCGASEYKVTT